MSLQSTEYTEVEIDLLDLSRHLNDTKHEDNPTWGVHLTMAFLRHLHSGEAQKYASLLKQVETAAYRFAHASKDALDVRRAMTEHNVATRQAPAKPAHGATFLRATAAPSVR